MICSLLLFIFTLIFSARADDAKPLKIAMSGAFQPFSTIDIQGKLSGFDADIAREIAKRIKRPAKLIQTDWTGIQAGLQSRKYELICGSMAITEARLKNMYFSLPYYVSGAQIFVREGIEKLDDARIGVTEDSTYAQWIQDHPKDFVNATIIRYGSEAEIVIALKTNKIDAFVSDRIVGGFYIKESGADNIKAFSKLLYQESCGIAARLDSATLVHEVNLALLSMVQDGSYTRIYQHWVGFPPDIHALFVSWAEHESQIPKLQLHNPLSSKDFATDAESMGPILFKGLWLTLKLVLFTAFLSLVLGTFLGILAVSRSQFGRALYTGYTFLVRGTPLMVQLFLSYFVIATAINEYFGFELMGAFGSAILALSVNATAYHAETVRGGILSIDSGQWQAAQALGMPRNKILLRIILPQAFYTVLPSIANNLVVLIKDTSLVGAITLVELTYAARNLVFQTGEAIVPFFLAGFLYLLLISSLLALTRSLEQKT